MFRKNKKQEKAIAELLEGKDLNSVAQKYSLSSEELQEFVSLIDDLRSIKFQPPEKELLKKVLENPQGFEEKLRLSKTKTELKFFHHWFFKAGLAILSLFLLFVLAFQTNVFQPFGFLKKQEKENSLEISEAEINQELTALNLEITDSFFNDLESLNFTF